MRKLEQRGNWWTSALNPFWADVLALEGEDANAIREGVRVALADYEANLPCAGSEQTNEG
jgi:hypothetical protein